MIRFEIDGSDIRRVARELGASERQVGMSITRSLRRTAGTLRRLAQPALVKGLDLRRGNAIRKRLRDLKMRRKGGAQEIGVWVGLNDLRIGDFKGSPKQTASGAEFRGVSYLGAFVAKSKSGKLTIFKRKGKGRFPIIEQTAPIKDQADQILEDEVYPDIAEIFMRHFVTDLRARTVFGVGRKE